MLTVPDIVDRLGGPTKFGRACGFTVNPGARGHDIKRRGSIPQAYWLRIVAAAAEADVSDVTLEALAKAHAPSSNEGAQA